MLTVKELGPDWETVQCYKRDNDGSFIKGPLDKTIFEYTKEISTGNLYGTQEGVDTAASIRLKATAIFFAAPFYGAGIAAANFAKILVDISSIFWRLIPDLISNFSSKSICASIGDFCVSLFWEIPVKVVEDIWRIARSPIYVMGMLFASVLATISPFEGRKWLGKIEQVWHQGTTPADDARHRKDPSELKDLSVMIKEIAEGKILYLGYCMLKRGNIHDMVGEHRRFEVIESKDDTTKINIEKAS